LEDAKFLIVKFVHIVERLISIIGGTPISRNVIFGKKKNETEWHRQWKEHFPIEWQEVVIKKEKYIEPISRPIQV
jgi:hypothetical protein